MKIKDIYREAEKLSGADVKILIFELTALVYKKGAGELLAQSEFAQMLSPQKKEKGQAPHPQKTSKKTPPSSSGEMKGK